MFPKPRERWNTSSRQPAPPARVGLSDAHEACLCCGMFVLRISDVTELVSRYRSDRADCICAIPGRPPTEHAAGCPVRLRLASAATTIELGAWFETAFAKTERSRLTEITLPCPFDCGRPIRTSTPDLDSLHVTHEEPECALWAQETDVLVARLRVPSA